MELFSLTMEQIHAKPNSFFAESPVVHKPMPSIEGLGQESHKKCVVYSGRLF